MKINLLSDPFTTKEPPKKFMECGPLQRQPEGLKRRRGSDLVLGRMWQCGAPPWGQCPTLDVSPQREGRWVLV